MATTTTTTTPAPTDVPVHDASLDDVLGLPVSQFPEKAKDKVVDAIEEAATEPGPAGVQPHGIANLTSPAPAATDEELRHYPDEVAKRQAEAFTQTAVGQAIVADEEKN